MVAPGTPSFYDILPMAILLLADNLDLLGSINGIIQSYIVLDCEGVLQVRIFDPVYSFEGIHPK